MKYDFNIDIQNEKFESMFAMNHLRKSFITKGYEPRFDVIDLETGKTYEIKRDYWYKYTKNILIEEYFNLEEQKKGWIFHTKADYFVVFVNDRTYYITNMFQVQADFFNNKDSWIKKDIYQDAGFTTRNWVKKLKCFDHEWYYLESIPC